MANKALPAPGSNYSYHLIFYCFSLAHSSATAWASLLSSHLASKISPQKFCTCYFFSLEASSLKYFQRFAACLPSYLCSNVTLSKMPSGTTLPQIAAGFNIPISFLMWFQFSSFFSYYQNVTSIGTEVLLILLTTVSLVPRTVFGIYYHSYW